MSHISPEHWQKIKRILDASAECAPEERRVMLDGACDGDKGLRRDVESFLAQEKRLQGFIDEPAVPELADCFEEPEEEAGLRIGPYRTVRLLGRGGMGAVYLAEREGEFEQRVALKLVQQGIHSRLAIRRFETERQILASLQHPNIARLLDGGTTDDGLPYFAMEYVEGQPIDRYCDAQRLDTRQRLGLILKVCSALAFAHQNLVIHRDLKPGNILVDANGEPKLLDFGIAKLLRPDLAPAAMVTGPGPQPMTLRYASPEQLQQGPMSTSSDIYSLGVLLYRLLTGRLPCNLERYVFPRLMMAVCNDEPARPSEVIDQTEELRTAGGDALLLTPQAVSATRGGSLKALRRRLSGDVDSIVLKALRKKPENRYASVEQLAEDIRRHLNGLPVVAREGTLRYRAGKFVRRHRVGLTALALILAMVIGFTAVLYQQLGRTERAREQAERERDRSARIVSFLNQLFGSSDPDQPEVSVATILERARTSLDDGLENDPENRAKLLKTLGRVYSNLGRYDEALQLLEASLESLRQVYERPTPELARAINDLATAHYRLGNYDQAEPLYREAIALRQELGGENLIKPLNNLAGIFLARGNFNEAEEILRQGLVLRRALFGDDHENVATNLRNLAAVHYDRGDATGARPYLEEALAIRLQHYGRDSTLVASVLSLLGRIELVEGNLAAAEELFDRTLAIRRERLGENHLFVALSKKDLAAVLLARGEPEHAQVFLSQALTVLYDTKPPGDWNIAEAESLLGALYAARGRYARAEACLLESHRTLDESRGPQAIYTRDARHRLDELYRAWGRPAPPPPRL